jgi:hypothetical protein
MKKKTGRPRACWRCSRWFPDPRKRRGRRYQLVFILAVAVACALSGARNFREAGDHACDLPQDVLARLGGRPHPLLRRIVAPSETRIRTLVHAIGADLLDEIIGGWLRGLANAGRLDGLLTAIAIDGKWLRGVLDGQVKLFAAILHEEKVIIAQHRIPDETAEYIAGKKEDGNRESDYFLFLKGNQPSLQRAVFDAIQEQGPREPDHTELDRGYGRIIRRSIWVAGAGDTGFPHVSRVARIRRDRYDTDGSLISKEIVHAVTSLGTEPASGASSPFTGCDTAWAEDASTGYAGNGPQIMATLRNLAVSLLYLAGVKEITRTLQAIARDRTRMLDYLPLWDPDLKRLCRSRGRVAGFPLASYYITALARLCAGRRSSWFRFGGSQHRRV